MVNDCVNRIAKVLFVGVIVLVGVGLMDGRASVLERLPDKVVVLTFDDSVKSHYTVARGVLKKYGFGATFFITEGFTFATNKKDYMSWEEIAELNRDGFEIGNHTRDHMGVTAKSVEKLDELDNAALVVKRLAVASPFVLEDDFHAAV